MATAIRSKPLDLAHLVRAHQAAVWRYLRYLGSDEAGAEDLAQETFLAVTRRPFEQRSPEATAAYLRKVARNLYLGTLRKRDRARVAGDMELIEAQWQEFDRDDGGREYHEALRECLEKLNGRARQAVDLHYRGGRSRKQVAFELDMSQNGVKSLLRRTRQLLRRCIEQNVE